MSQHQNKILVAFDLYGTLLSTASIAAKLSTELGIDDAKAASIAAVWRKYQLEYTWRLNSMKQYQPFSQVTRNALHHALQEHAIPPQDKTFTDKIMASYDSLSTFPDVRPALETLASNKNVTCVVLSNGTREMVINSVTKSPDLGPHASVFKKLVSVDFIQSFKPMPEVYKYLAQTMNMAGQEGRIWLVSGNPFDVAGARAVGMQAAWVDREGNGWQDKVGREPTVVVKSLEEVAAVVEDHVRRTANL